MKSISVSHAIFAKAPRVFILTIGFVSLGFLAACATQSVKVTGEVLAPSDKNPKVYVVPDPAPTDGAANEGLDLAVSQALKSQGFVVVASENEADLVILPLITAVAGSSTNGRPMVGETKAPLLFGNAMGESGLSSPTINFRAASDPGYVEPGHIGLLVTAIKRDRWANLGLDQNIPRMWRVTAVTALSSGQKEKLPGVLVDAAAPYFGKNTEGVVVQKVDLKNK